MLRYGNYCKKEYDFAPLAVSGKDDLICPVCKNVIPKSSRRPVNRSETEKTERAIGNAFGVLLHYSYVFYMSVALIGILGFGMQLYPMLYIATAVIVGVYGIQLVSGNARMWVLLFGIAGAVAGYLMLNIPGACLGVCIVFLLRHLIRDIFLTLLWKLVEYSKK